MSDHFEAVDRKQTIPAQESDEPHSDETSESNESQQETEDLSRSDNARNEGDRLNAASPPINVANVKEEGNDQEEMDCIENQPDKGNVPAGGVNVDSVVSDQAGSSSSAHTELKQEPGADDAEVESEVRVVEQTAQYINVFVS